jgi:hypothetical protein
MDKAIETPKANGHTPATPTAPEANDASPKGKVARSKDQAIVAMAKRAAKVHGDALKGEVKEQVREKAMLKAASRVIFEALKDEIGAL